MAPAAGDAFEDLATFELDLSFPRAERAVAAILSDLAGIVRAGAEKEAELERAFQRRAAKLRARSVGGEISGMAHEAALFKIESETVNRNTPEQQAAEWARAFSARLRAALAKLESGDPEGAFESLAAQLRTILAPTASAQSGLAALARGLQASDALSAGGRASKRRPRRFSKAELEDLRNKALAAKRADPERTQEQIAAELAAGFAVDISARHLASLLWARSDRRRS